MSELKKDVLELNKEIAASKKKLSELTEEIANALCGKSRFSEDVLATAIESCKKRLAEQAAELAEKQSIL